ncbi:MAG TPA: isocitrate/isopropylmalate family dehydrogenase, partial [Bradyrhizobium sp.]
MSEGENGQAVVSRQSALQCSVAQRDGLVHCREIKKAALAARQVTEGHSKMSSAKKQYRIAVIPGDGIGKEVVPEGLRVLEAAAKKHGVAVHFDHFDFASWDYYEKHGEMMPEDWKEKIGKHD